LVIAVTFLAGGLRVATADHIGNSDAPLWMARSEVFSDALRTGHLEDASASTLGAGTMPGTTVMWLGSIARVINAAGISAGVWEPDAPFAKGSLRILKLGQMGVAIVCALLIGLITYLVAQWTKNWFAAFFAGLFLATEPWLVALGAEFHTDEMSALFGTAGILAFAYALGVPNSDVRPRRVMLWAAIAGIVFIQAPLTKLPGLGLVPGFVGIAVWAIVRELVQKRGSWSDLRAVAIAAIAAVVTVPIAYPAMLVAPIQQWNDMNQSFEQGGLGHPQFFRGEITTTPGPTFYLVAIPWRMTPWLLLGTLVGLPAALAFRRSRMSAIILIAAALPLAKYMSTAAKQLDRYGLVFYVPLVLVAAIGLGECVRRLAGRPRQAALVAMAGIAAAAVVVSTAQLPIGTAYYNPLFGGAKAAQHVVLLGNGEGVPQAVELIRRRVDDKCKGVTVSGAEVLASLHIRCTKPPKKGVPPRFSIITITKAQRTASKPAAVFAARRQLVGTVTIHGVVYATVWEDRRPSTLSRQPGAKQPSAKQASAG
jgi:hypothetical protein